MAMRGGARRAINWEPHDFGWDRALLATLRHSTLPFPSEQAIAATPLKDLGGRDRLSLVAQFAAHQAFLQFAGVADSDVDPNEWVVVRKRGVDCRLIRIAARASTFDDAPPVLTLVQQFAEAIGAELDVLRQSWARAEEVYLEAHARLRSDVAADLRWLRRSACGRVLAPGPEALRALLAEPKGRWCCRETQAFSLLDEAVVLEGAGPFPPYAALRALGTFSGNESEVAERIVALGDGKLFVVTNEAAFDAPSKRVVDILVATGGATWVLPDRGTPLPDTQHFVLSPRLSARRALDERLATIADKTQWLEELVDSPQFDAYLDHGDVPLDAALPGLTEPTRSYVAALALLGTRISRELATRFLADFLFRQPLEELVVPGVSAMADDTYVFDSEARRAQAERLIPSGSRPALCQIAATMSSGIRAALLWIDAGDTARAAAILDDVDWPGAQQTIETLRRVPRAALSPKTARAFANALLIEGRYRDARELAPLLDENHRDLILAKADRRTGDYAPALARLERVAPSFEANVLKAELLRLHGRDDEARAILANCEATTAEEQARLAYERNETIESSHYLAARQATYRALEHNDYDTAATNARESLQRARGTAERVDAWLDCLYTAFSAGEWRDARGIAMEALAEVEQTQGDRAAGGILFTLAYLAADDGQWTHAAQRIARLRRFYSDTRDERRLRELALLAAQLDFARGRFADAKRYAAGVLSGDRDHDQILEAAALILDEIDGIEGRNTPLRSNGKSGNVELTNRHRALKNGLSEPHDDGTRTAQLKRFRWALAHGHRDVAESIARALDLPLEPPRRAGDAELRIYRVAATREFPFAHHDFDQPWCFATRNRLGHWNVIGPHAPSNLDEVNAGGDWLQISERELLYFEGARDWSDESREAIAALFRTRAENHRFRRIVEQEESAVPARADSVDGIVGNSAAIREVYSLITRVARRDVPVCILGESGTGKELVARAIHRNSARRAKIFTAVNCAALPENLIESELFGHVRGAFTGADRDRAGLIETTDSGTLFLDEIGEMPLTAQAKLLRFLQEGEFRRVGDTVNRSADVRIVSATNRKLESAVELGRFREDLYYRIRGVEIPLPPLRERAGDIPLLAAHFVTAERDKHRGGPAKLSDDAEALFVAYSWPGNVRELQNTIRAAHAMAVDAKEIDVEHLPERLRSIVPSRTVAGSYQDAVARYKRDLIEKSLLEARGNQNKAASMLRMSRQALAYQIRELGIMVRAR